MWLVDTSVWIEVLRKDRPLVLEDHVPLDEVVTALPIVQELLQGFDDERAFQIARTAITSMPIVESPLTEEVFLQAAQLYRSARRAGVTVRSSMDCLIAACAIRHQLPILHIDRDFDNIAKVAPLRALRAR